MALGAQRTLDPISHITRPTNAKTLRTCTEQTTEEHRRQRLGFRNPRPPMREDVVGHQEDMLQAQVSVDNLAITGSRRLGVNKGRRSNSERG
jgi:hypothetical protein